MRGRLDGAGFSQKHIDLPPHADPTASSLCPINAFPHFSLLCSCAGACRVRPAEARQYTVKYGPPSAALFLSCGQQMRVSGALCCDIFISRVSIDLYCSLDKISQDIVKRPSPLCTCCLEKGRTQREEVHTCFFLSMCVFDEWHWCVPLYLYS